MIKHTHILVSSYHQLMAQCGTGKMHEKRLVLYIHVKRVSCNFFTNYLRPCLNKPFLLKRRLKTIDAQVLHHQVAYVLYFSLKHYSIFSFLLSVKFCSALYCSAIIFTSPAATLNIL